MKYPKYHFCPLAFFKSHSVIVDNKPFSKIFYSSGTTGSVRSAHYVVDESLYKSISKFEFEKQFGSLKDSIILAMLPTYQENESSSLIYMVNHFIEESGSPLSDFVSIRTLQETVIKARQESKKIILFGVAYALLDAAEAKIDLSGVIIIETGGMKGKRREIVREELHRILKAGLGVENVHSEYGMTELLSQAYFKKNAFIQPSWMKVIIREINDPFQEVPTGRTGIIKVIDLANIYSCSFIETEDLGIKKDNGEFQVLGRVDNSDIRGCNLLYQN